MTEEKFDIPVDLEIHEVRVQASEKVRKVDRAIAREDLEDEEDILERNTVSSINKDGQRTES